MSGHAVDVNVLVAASTADPNTQSAEADHVPLDGLERVLEWVSDFRRDEEAVLVLDANFEIWREYRRRVSEQSLGFRVAIEKFQQARFHPIEVEAEGAVLPESLHGTIDDPDDRKYVAVAIKDEDCTVVNALDSGWCDWEETLRDHGIVVEQLLRGWLCGP